VQRAVVPTTVVSAKWHCKHGRHNVVNTEIHCERSLLARYAVQFGRQVSGSRINVLYAPSSKRPRRRSDRNVGELSIYQTARTHTRTHAHTVSSSKCPIPPTNTFSGHTRTYCHLDTAVPTLTPSDNCHRLLFRPARLTPYLRSLNCLSSGQASRPAPSSVLTWIPQVRLG
jgi:hypothetical protein